MNGGFATVDGIEDNERVDFKVREVEINIDRVETDQEINKGVLLEAGT